MGILIEEGELPGEICNREGCEGIIKEHVREGGCSCFINPPCSFCTEQPYYCPQCGWEAEDA